MHRINVLLQDTLDELASAKTLPTRVDELLASLEHLLADVCIPSSTEAQDDMHAFLKLQDMFDCNVCSRLLPWLSQAAVRLEGMSHVQTGDQRIDIFPLAYQLMKALSLLQGVALMHAPSKRHLGRRYVLEVIVDLLWTSRHVPALTSTDSVISPPSSPGSSHSDHPSNLSSTSLTSAVLDTLLCVLVDSSHALRIFEDLNGVHYVVKILKRAGSPREVRMKCLEFIYFYLMDETASPPDPLGNLTPPTDNTIDISGRLGRSSTPGPYLGRLSISSTHSASSSSSSDSYTSTTTATSATSVTSTPKASHVKWPSTSTSSTPSPTPSPTALAPSPRIITPPPSDKAQPRSLMMLRREVDFIPQSPKKAQISRLGLGEPKTGEALKARLKQRSGASAGPSGSQANTDEPHTPRPSRVSHSRTLSAARQASGSSVTSTPGAERAADLASKHRRTRSHLDVGGLGISRQSSWSSVTTVPESSRVPTKYGRRTMEEKREILGSMLGNVDALVDGVRKAGVWGLG